MREGVREFATACVVNGFVDLKGLPEKLSGTTKVIVAQRISTILHAEQILVLDDGRIVGKGTHEELLKSCEVYQQIAKSQLSEKELGLEESEVALHE